MVDQKRATFKEQKFLILWYLLITGRLTLIVSIEKLLLYSDCKLLIDITDVQFILFRTQSKVSNHGLLPRLVTCSVRIQKYLLKNQ